MSKQLQVLCVLLLAGIFVVQVLGLLVGTKSRVVAVPMRASANLASDDAEYDNCWMFWGTGYCDYYGGFTSGGGSSGSYPTVDFGNDSVGATGKCNGYDC